MSASLSERSEMDIYKIFEAGGIISNGFKVLMRKH